MTANKKIGLALAMIAFIGSICLNIYAHGVISDIKESSQAKNKEFEIIIEDTSKASNSCIEELGVCEERINNCKAAVDELSKIKKNLDIFDYLLYDVIVF